MAEKYERVDNRVESRSECLEDDPQNRADRLERSIKSLAEANHDLESKLQFPDGSFHATQMLARDKSVKLLKNCVEGQLQQFTDSITCLESFMIKEIKLFMRISLLDSRIVGVMWTENHSNLRHLLHPGILIILKSLHVHIGLPSKNGRKATY